MIEKTRDPDILADYALQIRRDSLRMVANAGSGHPGGAMGAAEIFAVLYGSVIEHNASKRPVDGPDHFVLSNGHICAGWYAALSLIGAMPRSELTTHRKLGSRLQGHPSKHKFPDAVETSSGPLGQGMSVASGIAMGKQMRGLPGRVFCLVGDGEIQEGLIWETALTAAHHRLQNLCVIVTDNNVQIDGPTSEVKNVRPVGSKFAAFGWNVEEVDGHDIPSLLSVFENTQQPNGKPTCVVAETTMAKGVSFMEHDPKWHGGCPTGDELATALAELGTASRTEDF